MIKPLGRVHLILQVGGGGGRDEDIEGRLQTFLDTQKGGSEKIRGASKICIFQNQQEGGGAPKKLNL